MSTTCDPYLNVSDTLGLMMSAYSVEHPGKTLPAQSETVGSDLAQLVEQAHSMHSLVYPTR